ncbi:hypothetical protein PR048_010451 [Dryococelus australis]|uniref:Uncharacterized protein n=1 Tax=Dryococelus australis TaxID=614101 RepID=A0ABQ9I2R5_9NEOP|nr:hypothetical protein PR048_010451 [Dryococelus australis]
MRVKQAEYGAPPECKGGGNGRSPRKLADHRHYAARLPNAKIRGLLCRKSSPVRLGYWASAIKFPADMARGELRNSDDAGVKEGGGLEDESVEMSSHWVTCKGREYGIRKKRCRGKARDQECNREIDAYTAISIVRSPLLPTFLKLCQSYTFRLFSSLACKQSFSRNVIYDFVSVDAGSPISLTCYRMTTAKTTYHSNAQSTCTRKTSDARLFVIVTWNSLSLGENRNSSKRNVNAPVTRLSPLWNSYDRGAGISTAYLIESLIGVEITFCNECTSQAMAVHEKARSRKPVGRCCHTRLIDGADMFSVKLVKQKRATVALFTATMLEVTDFPPAGHFSRLSSLVARCLSLKLQALVNTITFGSKALRTLIVTGLDLEGSPHPEPGVRAGKGLSWRYVFRNKMCASWIIARLSFKHLLWPAAHYHITSLSSSFVRLRGTDQGFRSSLKTTATANTLYRHYCGWSRTVAGRLVTGESADGCSCSTCRAGLDVLGSETDETRQVAGTEATFTPGALVPTTSASPVTNSPTAGRSPPPPPLHHTDTNTSTMVAVVEAVLYGDVKERRETPGMLTCKRLQIAYRAGERNWYQTGNKMLTLLAAFTTHLLTYHCSCNLTHVYQQATIRRSPHGAPVTFAFVTNHRDLEGAGIACSALRQLSLANGYHSPQNQRCQILEMGTLSPHGPNPNTSLHRRFILAELWTNDEGGEGDGVSTWNGEGGGGDEGVVALKGVPQGERTPGCPATLNRARNGM